MKFQRLAIAALALVVASTAVAAIVSSSKYKLSIGTSFDVAGSGFAKPVQAWLDFNGTKVALKIAKGASDTNFTAKLASIPARAHGDCLLTVRAAGSKTPFHLAGMSIELPSADSLDVASAGEGDEVTINGTYFGTKQGHVTLGTKRAKVTHWGDEQIKFVVPKGLPAGLIFVDVDNRAGTSVSRPTLMIHS